MGHALAGCALTFAGFAFRAAFASAASSSRYRQRHRRAALG
jgi:hypothetical protein